MPGTPTPLTELFSTLKGYVNQLSSGERTASEVGSALNDWARDSAESVKAKIAEEVEATVAKMGFIKREEYDALAQRLSKIESDLAKLRPGKSDKSKVKKSAKEVLKRGSKSNKAKVEK
jgi:BMFP domain-containing protein YqiC